MNIDSNVLGSDMIWFMILFGGLSLLIRFFYARTLRNLFNLIAEENRHLQPKEAWYVMIPLFDMFWNFRIAQTLSDSLTNEFYDRKIAEEPNPGKTIGTTYALLYLASYFPLFPGFNVFMTLISFAYFVRYWVKVGEFKTIIEEHIRLFDKKES